MSLRHHAEFHWPRFYRYRLPLPRLGLYRNRYYGCGCKGSAFIGLAIDIGRYAYCVKWADARIVRCAP